MKLTSRLSSSELKPESEFEVDEDPLSSDSESSMISLSSTIDSNRERRQ